MIPKSEYKHRTAAGRKHPPLRATPDELVARVWRTYLTHKVLGYVRDHTALVARTAADVGVDPGRVRHVLTYYPPRLE